jgi:hypothetical protein
VAMTRSDAETAGAVAAGQCVVRSCSPPVNARPSTFSVPPFTGRQRRTATRRPGRHVTAEVADAFTYRRRLGSR